MRHHAGAGAFPEIQVAQYPLDMGRSDQSKSTKTLATTVGADGSINFDAIVKQGRNKDKHIATTHNAMVPKLDKLKDEVKFSLLRHQQSCGAHSPLSPAQLACVSCHYNWRVMHAEQHS